MEDKTREALEARLPDIFEDLSITDLVVDWTLPVMIIDHELRFRYANAAYLRMMGCTWPELRHKRYFDTQENTEDRQEIVESHLRRALAGEMTRMDAYPYNIPNDDGSIDVRYWETVNNPVRDQSGKVRFVIQLASDVTDRVEARHEIELVAKELSHRTKNVLAVVTSIARMIGREQETKEDFLADFTARIGTISRAHARLYANDFVGMELRDLLQEEIGAMASSENYQLSGVDMMVNERTSRDLSMVIHELATNATKHGAFSKASGHLLVSWDVVGDDLILTWQETGVGPIGEVDETGFGSKLLRIMPSVTCRSYGTDDGMKVIVECAGFKV